MSLIRFKHCWTFTVLDPHANPGSYLICCQHFVWWELGLMPLGCPSPLRLCLSPVVRVTGTVPVSSLPPWPISPVSVKTVVWIPFHLWYLSSSLLTHISFLLLNNLRLFQFRAKGSGIFQLSLLVRRLYRWIRFGGWGKDVAVIAERLLRWSPDCEGMVWADSLRNVSLWVSLRNRVSPPPILACASHIKLLTF